MEKDRWRGNKENDRRNKEKGLEQNDIEFVIIASICVFVLLLFFSFVN